MLMYVPSEGHAQGFSMGGSNPRSAC